MTKDQLDAIDELWTQDQAKAEYMADSLCKYLAARGLEIREKAGD